VWFGSTKEKAPTGIQRVGEYSVRIVRMEWKIGVKNGVNIGRITAWQEKTD
jgi:hypothetical protein